jgi:uracil-DNA glycosylase family 4
MAAPRTSPLGVDLDCVRCALSRGRTQVVPGSGDLRARLMLVGEAPGATEDELGEPFVGRAGKVLDAALSDAGLARGEVWIANAVRCRPPDNRAPTPGEVAACSFQLDAELAAVAPRVVVLLGISAARAVLGHPVKVEDEAGEAHRVRRAGLDLVCLVTYHPQGVVYRRSARARLVEDLTRGRAMSL